MKASLHVAVCVALAEGARSASASPAHHRRAEIIERDGDALGNRRDRLGKRCGLPFNLRFVVRAEMETKATNYRRRAKKAEEHADEARDRKVEEIWRDAALKWRQLAGLTELIARNH